MSYWKILYHHRTQGRGVEGVHILSVVDALESRGHEVVIVSPPGADPRRPRETEKATGKGRRGPWHFVSRYLPQFLFEFLELAYNFAAHRRLKKAMRDQGKTDVYYERYALFLLAGTRLMKKRGVPIVLEVQDSAHLKRVRPIFFQKLAAAIERRTFDRADALIVVTEAFKQIFVEHGTPPEKIHVIQNTARSDLFDHGISGARVRKKLGLEHATIVGFLGKAVPWHGVDSLLLACRELVDQHTSLHVIIVGDDSGHPELRVIAADAKLRDRVHFVGQVPHVETPEYIAAMDIAVMPNSNSFGSPVKLFEYMAMRRAIVAPRLGPVEEVLEHGKHALLVSPGDADSVREALEWLLDDPSERERLAAAAHQHFEDGYSWERNADRTVEILCPARPSRRPVAEPV